MNAFSVEFNKEYAKAAAGSSDRITTTGKYKGKISLAKYRSFSTGSQGVEIHFTSDDNQSARFTLVAKNKNGEDTFGMKKLHAIMACTQTRSLASAPKIIDEYNYDSKSTERVERTVYPSLEKKIGFILQREDYTNSSGNDSFRMNLNAPFVYETEQTADEFLNDQAAAKLPNLIASLKDIDKREHSKSGNFASLAGSQPANNFDDDIPF